MLGSARTGTACRALATIVALTLSGAPRLAASLQPDPPHVCQCRAHGKEHRCACPVCAKVSRDARRGAAKDLPPCHREVALAALAEEEAHAAREARAACVEPSCGGAEKARTLAAADTYLLPRPPAVSPPRGVERLVARAVREADLPAVPDVPPPKRR